jgi:hypothetical protein
MFYPLILLTNFVMPDWRRLRCVGIFLCVVIFNWLDLYDLFSLFHFKLLLIDQWIDVTVSSLCSGKSIRLIWDILCLSLFYRCEFRMYDWYFQLCTHMKKTSCKILRSLYLSRCNQASSLYSNCRFNNQLIAWYHYVSLQLTGDDLF